MNIKALSARKLRRFRVYCEGVFTAETQRGEAAAKKGKANFTTKEDATWFEAQFEKLTADLHSRQQEDESLIIKKIRTLRGLRDLRGEDML